MDHDGYPIDGWATLTKTNLTVVYTNLPRFISDTSNASTQVWYRKTIMEREFLFGPVAMQNYESQGLVTYDALISLSQGESTNSIPSAETLGIKLAK